MFYLACPSDAGKGTRLRGRIWLRRPGRSGRPAQARPTPLSIVWPRGRLVRQLGRQEGHFIYETFCVKIIEFRRT